jgi:hypothetical protein
MNRDRVDLAMTSIAEMAAEAVREHRTGTVGVEISKGWGIGKSETADDRFSGEVGHFGIDWAN